MKRRRYLLVRLLVALPLAFAAVLTAVHYNDVKYATFKRAVHDLQLEIERYAVDTEGAYPPDLATLVSKRHITLPPNPFGSGRIKVLKQGDPYEPGGVVYVPFGPIVAVGMQDAAMKPIIPRDYDMYLLVGYSPRHHSGRAKVEEEALNEMKVAKKQVAEGAENVSFPITAEGIDWDHVEIELTAGAGDVDPDRGNPFLPR